MPVFRVPLTNTNSKFNISLGGEVLTIVSRWNEEMPAWVIDIYDANTTEPKILALPLVTGANLLMQFTYLGIRGLLIAYTNGQPFAPPTFENLGVESNLYYVNE